MRDYLFDSTNEHQLNINFPISENSVGLYLNIEYFELNKKFLNNFGIDYKPYLEIGLPGYLKNIQIYPFNGNIYTDTNSSNFNISPKNNTDDISNSFSNTEFKNNYKAYLDATNFLNQVRKDAKIYITKTVTYKNINSKIKF